MSDETATRSEDEAAADVRLRSSGSSARLTVRYPGVACQVELALGKKKSLLLGEWNADVRIDGRPVRPAEDAEWQNTCRVSDADGDYLELELELTEGIRLQRHFFLAGKDGFLFVADAVLGERPAAIEYRGTLPLADDVTFRAANCELCNVRQFQLSGKKKPRAVVMPLAIDGDCRGDSHDETGGKRSPTGTAANSLRSVDRLLELRQRAEGRSLFAPLWLDLDRRRFERHSHCRRLTVGESLQKQPDDVAVGYRVVRGKRQWLIYRSLAERKARTLLGHHLSSETLIARFTPEGEVESLIEIE